jgi:hypothetical protein
MPEEIDGTPDRLAELIARLAMNQLGHAEAEELDELIHQAVYPMCRRLVGDGADEVEQEVWRRLLEHVRRRDHATAPINTHHHRGDGTVWLDSLIKLTAERETIRLSFDLAVLAIDGWTDVSEVAAMVDRCQSPVHVEGELDERIVGFYERLRARFPDFPPYSDPCPWMSMPLDVGIDHVFMCLSFSERSDPAITLITELATEYGLTLWDPQDRSAHKPVTAPSRQEVMAWWGDLLDGRCNREETFDRVRPWVEDSPEAIDDPITSMGLQHLHGFALTAEGRGGYLHDDQHIRAAFEQWLTHATRFDADPVGWRRDRYSEVLHAILRDQGRQHAQALAKRLVAAGWLSAGDVTQILGSTTELPNQDPS